MSPAKLKSTKPEAKGGVKQKSRKVGVELLSKQTSGSTSGGVENEAEQIALLWKEEVEALRGQSFESVDEAIEAVIDRVLLRLTSNNVQVEPDMREFLRLVCSTDETVVEVLRETFHIRSSDRD
jgi:hypothetical protein